MRVKSPATLMLVELWCESCFERMAPTGVGKTYTCPKCHKTETPDYWYPILIAAKDDGGAVVVQEKLERWPRLHD